MANLSAHPMGSFRRDLSTGAWTWSDDMFRLHGYPPGDVELSTELVLEHKHTEDRPRAADIIRTVSADGIAFSNYHRIVDASGRMRRVLSVGDVITGPVGNTPVAMRGFTIDLTERLRSEETEAVAASAAHRAAIEQAKGVLMATYGLDPDAAMAFLKRWSMDRNIKVAVAAEWLVESFRSPAGGGHPGVQAVLEALAAS